MRASCEAQEILRTPCTSLSKVSTCHLSTGQWDPWLTSTQATMPRADPPFGHQASSAALSAFQNASPFWSQPQFPREELREEGTKHLVHHRSGYPHASLGPLNAPVTPIKDFGMVPPRSSNHCSHALGYLSAQ